MKLIKPSYEIIPQQKGLEGIYKQIELAGRICYASEPKNNVSAEQFVQRLINSEHYSPLEHGTVYLYFNYSNFLGELDYYKYTDIEQKYLNNKYSKVVFVTAGSNNTEVYITTNYRVLVENNWLDDLQYLCNPCKYHAKRISVQLICDIGITREANRHRSFSICEQSTRYCNFSKNKFNEEITFIEPNWSLDSFEGEQFKLALTDAERRYMQLIEGGWKPQQARNVLPLATASKVFYTAFENDWKHFFELRCNEAAHPQMRELAIPLRKEMFVSKQ